MVGAARTSAPTEAASSDPDTLEHLLSRVVRGDEQAYAIAYGRISAPIYGLVRRVMRDAALSEEVAQEVLLYVWQSASRFDESRGSAMAWVMTIAHRRAIDRVRAEESHARRTQRAGDHDQTVLYDLVSDEVVGRLERESVRGCLTALTILQREAVTLAYYGGLTYREVAAQLDIPLGTVKTRIRDGLLRLRDCLGCLSPG